MGTILKIMNLEPIQTLIPYLFAPLISEPDSLLDNAPNYLVWCVIQKRTISKKFQVCPKPKWVTILWPVVPFIYNRTRWKTPHKK